MKTYKTLYTQDTFNNTRIWYMQQDGNKYRTVSGILNSDKLVYSDWVVTKPKNSGKTNETTPEKQAEFEIKSKYKKQLKTGYWENVNDITNQKYIEPILAHKYKDYVDYVDFDNELWVSQTKFNGVCCIFTKNGAYSRKGEKFLTVEHIENVLKPFFDVFPQAVLHGELFNNDLRQELNKIVSIIRKTKNITDEDLKISKETIKYHIYDGYFPNIIIKDISKISEKDIFNSFLEKIDESVHKIDFGTQEINKLKAEYLSQKLNESAPYFLRKAVVDLVIDKYNKNGILEHVKSKKLISKEDMKLEFKNAMINSDEGIILRKFNMPYEHKRSKNLLKVKPDDSEEMTITDIKEGRGNWSGMAKIITLKMKNGKEFDGTFKGTQSDAIECLKNKDKWVGKVVTINFNGVTAYGIPQYAQFNYKNCLRAD